MRVEWFGQSAFRLDGDGKTVAIDPFGDMSALSRERGELEQAEGPLVVVPAAP